MPFGKITKAQMRKIVRDSAPRRKRKKTFEQRVNAVVDKDVEFNMFQVGPTSYTPASAGTIFPLSEIPQGDGIAQRLGRMIQLRSIRLKLYNTDSQAEFIRYILFFDMEQDGSDPTVLEVLNTASYMSFKNFNERKRFNVIVDNTLSTEDWNNNHSYIEYYRRFNRKIQYLGGGAGVETDNGPGSLYLLVISQANGTVDSAYYNAQIRYTDA